MINMKDYNPLKMWAGYTGAVAGGILGYFLSKGYNPLGPGCAASTTVCPLGITVIQTFNWIVFAGCVIGGFLVGWGIQSLFVVLKTRKRGN